MHSAFPRPAIRLLAATVLALAASSATIAQSRAERGTLSNHLPAATATAGACATCPTGPTAASLVVGVDGTEGCQGFNGTQPLLGNGAIANARLDFAYDNLPAVPGVGLLTLCVTNETPPAATAGQLDPVITKIAFNLPSGLVSAVGLAGQCSAGGARPGFILSSDPGTSPQLSLGCFGQFNLLLAADRNNGAIGSADPAAAFGVSNVATGPVRFDIFLIGAGVNSLSAGLIAFSLSVQPTRAAVAAATVFEGGLNARGPGGGTLAARDANPLNPGITAPTVAVPMPIVFAPPATQPPLEVLLNLTGDPGAHPCLLLSIFSGNTFFAGISNPIPLGSGMTNQVIAFPVGQPFPASGQLTYELPVPISAGILQALQQGSRCPAPRTPGEECLFLCVVAVPPGPGPQPDVDALVSPRFDMRVRLKPLQ